MNPHARLSNKWMRRLVVAGVLAVVTLVAACVFFRISSPGDIEAYLGMARECHPAWRPLALRRVGAGDSAAEFLRRHPPNFRDEFGRYGVYRYYRDTGHGLSFTTLHVVARDGRLLRAQASSCTWRFTFFDTPDPALDAEYAAFAKQHGE